MTEDPTSIDEARVRKAYDQLKADASFGGYHLNPDEEFTLELVRGLLANEDRYGYWACPCRLAEGVTERDLDIICPCEYRDPDLDEFNQCFCCLYVSDEIVSGKEEMEPIPDRRPSEDERSPKWTPKPDAVGDTDDGVDGGTLRYPVWRCSVCGYLCAREQPPAVCPICKVKRERFERFM